MCRNTTLLLSALMAVHLAQRCPGSGSTDGNDTGTFFAIGGFADTVTFTASGRGRRGAGSERLGDLLRCLSARCEDSAIVGKAQLTAGTAKLKFIPGIGTHKYTAIFTGTAAAAASTSTAQTLTVTGLYPTTTAIAATGNPSGYELTATVVGYANQSAGTRWHCVFSRHKQRQLRSGNRPPRRAHVRGELHPGDRFSHRHRQPTHSRAPADFNGDGIPDLAVMDS